MSASLVIMGILMHSTLPAIIGMVIPTYLGSVRFMRSITITDAGLEFNGILKHWSAKWEEVRRVKKVKDYGWPVDRMFGDFTYEIQTTHGSRIVSFLFFPGNCLGDIKEKTRPNHTSDGICQPADGLPKQSR